MNKNGEKANARQMERIRDKKKSDEDICNDKQNKHENIFVSIFLLIWRKLLNEIDIGESEEEWKPNWLFCWAQVWQ